MRRWILALLAVVGVLAILGAVAIRIPAVQDRLVRTAQRYLRQLGHPEIRYRYDIVEVVFRRGAVHDLRYWPAEFGASDAMGQRRGGGRGSTGR